MNTILHRGVGRGGGIPGGWVSRDPTLVELGSRNSFKMFENSDKFSGNHESWRLFPALEEVEMPHIELSTSKLDSILLE